MQNEKPWYLSKTIWAAVISILATVATFFGVPIDEAGRQGLTDGLLQIVSAVAGVFAILGRVTANSKLI
ncbi:MAG: hypothetical protein U5K75_01450 [Ahrensia sp.]|nr:hypothetical protein [Ahrensia sp.]